MSKKDQDRLKLYTITDDYLDYLRKSEPKIPINKEGGKPRPFVGVILSIAGNDYFAPLSSQKHDKRSDVKIMKSGEQVATVRCSFMFPVHKDALKEIDFTKEMTKDRPYTAILINEIQYLNTEEAKKKLLETASKTYNYCIDKKFGFEKFCCDFKTLEERAKTYGTIEADIYDLRQALSKENIATNHPKISEKDLKTIETLVLLQLSQKDNPKAIVENLENLQKQLPDVESGKIVLPDLPTQDKGKGGR